MKCAICNQSIKRNESKTHPFYHDQCLDYIETKSYYCTKCGSIAHIEGAVEPQCPNGHHPDWIVRIEILTEGRNCHDVQQKQF